MAATLRDSLKYKPQPLAFGTSGLRALVSDLTQLEVVINTTGFLRFLRHTARIRPGDTVWVAGDLRPSTTQPVEVGAQPRGEILQAVLWAITAAGYRPSYLGALPTPALMLRALSQRQASVMVTGSHIPFDRNGIKFNTPSGEVMKDDESAILAQVRAVREEIESATAESSPFAPNGQLKASQRPVLPEEDPSGHQLYLQRYLEAFPPGVLANRRIVVYQHSAVGRDLLVTLLEQLGAQVIPAGRSEAFIPIDTEAVQPAMLQDIQRLVEVHGGPSLDAVVSTDGDSDRPLLLGIDRGQVRFLGGDLLGIVVADYLGARQVAVPISANDAVDCFFESRGISVIKTRIGSPYVVAAMREVGWEANGGFLTARPCRIPGGGTLPPLPTRDAFLPLLAALYASLGQGRRLVDHFARLPRRFGKAAVIRDFPRAVSLSILERFRPADPDVEEARFEPEGSRIRLTSSGELRPASPEQETDLQHKRGDLETAMRSHLGPVQVSWINFCDGLRFATSQQEILHFRPSGNAPEQRVYAVADSEERAEALVGLAVSPGGMVETLRASTPVESNSGEADPPPPWLRLQGVVQHYAWGGTSFIPQLLGRPNAERQPFAELWFGSHHSAPSLVRQGRHTRDLRVILHDQAAAFLGSPVVTEFGRELPYLLKVLDARQMLSIQAHPNRTQAREGFDRENRAGISLEAPHRNYRDPHPKPEVHVALTPFWLLHGFRPLEELVDELDRTPELKTAWPSLPDELRQVKHDTAARRHLLRSAYEHVMRMPQAEVNAILQPLVERLAHEDPSDKAGPDFWVHRAAATFARPDGGCDRGLFSLYLLNLVQLRPGESTFQDAGVLHAYLEGATAELMACSDNVLRGGLTPKHVDVDELLRIVRFVEGQPRVSAGHRIADDEWVFPAEAREFALRRLVLRPGVPRACVCESGPECLLLLEGTARIRSGVEEALLERGACVLVPADRSFQLEHDSGPGVVLRACMP